jgi:hypothetical protein
LGVGKGVGGVELGNTLSEAKWKRVGEEIGEGVKELSGETPTQFPFSMHPRITNRRPS